MCQVKGPRSIHCRKTKWLPNKSESQNYTTAKYMLKPPQPFIQAYFENTKLGFMSLIFKITVMIVCLLRTRQEQKVPQHD